MIKKDNLDVQIHIRVSKKQKKEIERKAVSCGFRTVSEFALLAIEQYKNPAIANHSC
jgi:uncharacterized protein (DUF1778 family)